MRLRGIIINQQYQINLSKINSSKKNKHSSKCSVKIRQEKRKKLHYTRNYHSTIWK